jgi:hypothetical protein
LVQFVVIWYIFPFWYVWTKKIWQPWNSPKTFDSLLHCLEGIINLKGSKKRKHRFFLPQRQLEKKNSFRKSVSISLIYFFSRWSSQHLSGQPIEILKKKNVVKSAQGMTALLHFINWNFSPKFSRTQYSIFLLVWVAHTLDTFSRTLFLLFLV